MKYFNVICIILECTFLSRTVLEGRMTLSVTYDEKGACGKKVENHCLLSEFQFLSIINL